MHAVVNGVSLHYRVDGPGGAPWITFINGIANDLTMWDGQVAALERDFRILRYDQRGHGGSEAVEPPYSLDMLIGDLVGLWNELGIERASLAGLGLGGALAIGVGIRHSDRLSRLVPSCCRAKMTPDFASIWPDFVKTVERHGMEGMVEPTVQRWFTNDFKAANPHVLDNIRRMIRATDPRGYYGCIAAFLTLDFFGEIQRIKVPTLFISGADDHLGGPPKLMQGLADAVRGARHVSVPNAAHICNIQNPEAYNAVIGEFLRAR